MAIIITDDCIICHACVPECPNTAIYEPEEEWSFAEGTRLTVIEYEDGTQVDASTKFDPIEEGFQGANGYEYYYIAPDKCTECHGFHEEPACAAVCPTEACVPDPDREEDPEELLAKKEWLHGTEEE